MKPFHLGIATLVGSAIGLLLVLALSLLSTQRLQQAEHELTALSELQQRINTFSVASDGLLLHGADPDLWQAVRAEAARIQRRLERLGARHPDALKAAHQVRVLIDAIAQASAPGDAGTAPRDGLRPLALAPRARLLLTQIAGHGTALDTALSEVIGERRAAIASDKRVIALRLAAAAVLFAVFGTSAFALLYWKMAAPAQRLIHAIEAIRTGDADARAPVSGPKVFAEVSRTLNRMLEERHRREQRLRQYRALVEGSDDLFAICDADYRYLLVNAAYARLFGRTPAQIEGASVPEVLGAPYFQETAKAHIDACLAGQAQQYRTERQNADGIWRSLLVRYYPIPGRDEHRPQAVGVITDISDLARAEAQLRAQSRLLEIAGRVGRFGGWWVDLQTGRQEWSDTVADIHGMPHGYTPKVDEGIAFYAPEHRPQIRAAFSACTERGEPYDLELQIIDAGGRRVWVRATGAPVRDAAGAIVAAEGSFQDIDRRKLSEEAAQRLGERLNAMLERMTDAFFLLDAGWRFSYLNPEAERLMQRSRRELTGQCLWEAFPEMRGTALEARCRQAMATRESTRIEDYCPAIGRWVDTRIHPADTGLAVYLTDVSERHELLEALREQEQTLRRSRDQLAELLRVRKALIDSLPAHIALLDTEGRIVDVNDQWRCFGKDNDYGDSDLGLGRSYLEVCEQAAGERAEEAPAVARGLRQVLDAERESFSLEYPCHAPHEERWFRLSANRLVSDMAESADHSVVVMHVDISERKRAERELQQLAFRDRLTGLLSRVGFTAVLRERLAAGDWPRVATVAMLDVQDLRDVNDAHGYEAGDQLLVEIGRWLEAQVGADGLVGRIGGDELVVFLRAGADEMLEARLQALAAMDQQPFLLNHGPIEVSVHIGYTDLGERRRSAEDLLREAELALFQKRERASDRVIAYTADLDHRVRERIAMTWALRRALDRDELELHYQPKVDLRDGRLIACEALLRWRHPERGLLAPGLFIPLAEQGQLIVPIGEWVLHEACRRLSQWQRDGLDVVGVAVNVSVSQFSYGGFHQQLDAALAAHGVAPDALILEVTESVFERESHSLQRQLEALHETGIRLSLDDFGTGYSSLSYLQRYPFDEIKVDQAFVRHMLTDAFSHKVVDTVLGLGRALGADVIAEGIESEAVCTALRGLGYRFGQGYFYSLPLEAEDFRWLLEQHSRLPLGQSKPIGSA
ncbi:EAL domain-containing protein [Thiohalocapsa halophila]|nr:EAL domain-containing protein [Thiohalocapsa halophila]